MKEEASVHQPRLLPLSLSISIKIYFIISRKTVNISIAAAIIGSVVPPVTSLMREAIRKVTGQEALVVNVDMNIGLEVLMDNPSSVGTDLIVGAVAGINRYPVPKSYCLTPCFSPEPVQILPGKALRRLHR